MFQVWFMRNNADETLQGYNQRLGRPRAQIRHGIVGKTKYILGSQSWWDYFDELGVIIQDDNAIDQLLRFAIYNSNKKGYHYMTADNDGRQKVDPPKIDISDRKNKAKQNNVRGSGWRGRGHSGQTRYQNTSNNNNYQSRSHAGSVNNNHNHNLNPYHAPSRLPQMPQHQFAHNTMNRNINNNSHQIQAQQPVMPLIPNANQNQYRVAATQQIHQQPVIPLIMPINNGINVIPNMIQRPSQVQNTVNRNFGWNQYQAPTPHYQQQQNMNHVNLNSHLIQRPMAQIPQIPNVPLCAYYRSAVGCALGQSCMYRH